jgi:hypothetical protein
MIRLMATSILPLEVWNHIFHHYLDNVVLKEIDYLTRQFILGIGKEIISEVLLIKAKRQLSLIGNNRFVQNNQLKMKGGLTYESDFYYLDLDTLQNVIICKNSKVIIVSTIDNYHYFNVKSYIQFNLPIKAERIVEQICIVGNLELVQLWLSSLNIKITYEMIINASKNGHLDLVLWFYYKLRSYRSSVSLTENIIQYIIDYAAYNNHFKIIKWFYEKSADLENPIQFHYDNAIDFAALNGHLELIKWFYEKSSAKQVEQSRLHRSYEDRQKSWISSDFTQPIKFGYICAINFASWGGHLHIIEWFYDKWVNDGLEFKYDFAAVDYAAKFGYSNIIEWFWSRKNIFLCRNPLRFCNSPWAITYAAKYGHLNVIKWFWSKSWWFYGLKFSYYQSVIENMVNNNELLPEIVEWFKNNNLIMTS